MKYHNFPSIFLIITLIGILSCAEGDIRYAMADIDRAYIPGWMSLKKDKTQEAVGYLYTLENEWFILKETELTDWENAYWAPMVREVDLMLHQALTAAEKGNNWESMVAMDRIRLKLIHFRKKHYIDYYLDRIWDFHTAYTEFNEIANDDVLCWLSWEDMTDRSKKLRQLWKAVKFYDPEPEIFYLDTNKLKMYNASREAINNELLVLEDMIACADRENLALSSIKIGLHLDEMIKAFGDFDIVIPQDEPKKNILSHL